MDGQSLTRFQDFECFIDARIHLHNGVGVGEVSYRPLHHLLVLFGGLHKVLDLAQVAGLLVDSDHVEEVVLLKRVD